MLKALFAVTALFAFCIGLTTLSAMAVAPTEIARVLRVHDGDTFIVDLKNCLQPIVCTDIPIRIAGIDTPEILGKCKSEAENAVKAKILLQSLLHNARKIELFAVKRDKFFRLRAEVWIDGVNISNIMLEQGLARKYDGGKRAGWCGL